MTIDTSGVLIFHFLPYVHHAIGDKETCFSLSHFVANIVTHVTSAVQLEVVTCLCFSSRREIFHCFRSSKISLILQQLVGFFTINDTPVQQGHSSSYLWNFISLSDAFHQNTRKNPLFNFWGIVWSVTLVMHNIPFSCVCTCTALWSSKMYII